MSEKLKRTSNSLKWSAIERIATQAIQLLVMLYLGRKLGPEAFGVVGMMAIFIAISQTLVDSGFGNALVRKLDRNETDFATTFYFSIFVSFLCYVTLFLISPLVAEFFEHEELISLLRVLGLTIIFNSITVVQRTKLTIEMDFKRLAFISFISVLVSSTSAVVFVNYEISAWVLVTQTLIFSICSTLLTAYFKPWKPRCFFNRASFDELFGFGSKLLLASLIDTIYNNIFQVFIGRFFSASQLGIFTQAKFLSETPSMTLANIVMRVVYPALSKIQENNEKLRDSYIFTLKLTMIIGFPIIFSVAAISEPLVKFSLGSDWEEVIPLISILCLGFVLFPLHAINLNLLKVKGLSGLILRLQVLKKFLGILFLVFSYDYGVTGICIAISVHSYCSFIINSYYTGLIVRFNLAQQMKMFLPIWIIAITTWFGTYIVVDLMAVNEMLSIVMILFFGSVLYYSLMFMIYRKEVDIFNKSLLNKL
ncbi:lipopolysaccharide biosynthesis protein [Vibrio cyclitrophicus]